MLRITRKGLNFYDENSRQVFFNGVNICFKEDKSKLLKQCKKIYSQKTVDELKSNGFNLVRLGMTWAGIEPEQGEYDDEYLDVFVNFASLLEKNGIYFIIDMHQDLYSPKAGFGDGAPDWATVADGHVFTRPVSIWAEGYFYSKAVGRAFDNFWENKKVNGKGLQDSYCEMWQYVIKRFENNTALLGYDFMNEPYPGSDGHTVFTTLVDNFLAQMKDDKNYNFNSAQYFTKGKDKAGFIKMAADIIKEIRRTGFSKLKQTSEDEEKLKKVISACAPIIKKFDEERYSPFIEKLTKAAREVTDKGIVFIENCYYSNLGIPCCAKLPVIDGEQEEQVAFSPHGYDIFVDSPLYSFASETRVRLIFDEHKRTQERLGVPIIVGEWGGFGNNRKMKKHGDFLVDIFDKNNWGRMYWLWQPNASATFAKKIIAHSYPQYLCGEAESFSRNEDDTELTIVFNQAQQTDTENVIYTSKKVKRVELNGQKISFHSSKQYNNSLSNSSYIYLKTPVGRNELKIYM